jgi:glutamate 5-kinase
LETTKGVEALRKKKKSLLPSGILKVQGRFEAKQVVELETPEGQIFGRGLVRLSSQELLKIAGRQTKDLKQILGYQPRDEVIHRNDLVLWE